VSFDPAGAPVTSSRRGFFWVGIEPVAQPLGTVLRGPMYDHPEVLGPMGPQAGFEYLRPIFVPPPEGEDSHPTSALHTQWPGGREPGDPVLDQWLAPAGPMLAVGPPFVRLPEAGLDLTWGVTTVPIEFDPAVGSAAELELVTESARTSSVRSRSRCSATARSGDWPTWAGSRSRS
jgi:hypothetical protein